MMPVPISEILALYAVSQVYHDPLALDLNGDGHITTISLNDSNAYFDLDADGFKERTGWIAIDDGLLIIDQNNNGIEKLAA